MKKARVKKATRRQYEDWFKGELLLRRAMLHVQAQYVFYPGDFPLGALGDPSTYLHTAWRAIQKERREAAR
jgi:hypothetical protein